MRFVILICVLTLAACAHSTVEVEEIYPVTAPPATEVDRLNLNPIYKKYVSAQGFPVIGTENVSDYALKEAAYLIDIMLEGRDDIRQAMIKIKTRMIIYAHDEYTTDFPEHKHLEKHENGKDWWDRRARGLGGNPRAPATSCGEENLLCFEGDPYRSENILVHEFAHTIHHCGIDFIDKTFDERLKKIWLSAIEKGLWKGKYASNNRNEYWAEAVQSWFNDNRENDHDHNHVNTRQELIDYDPDVAKLCEEIFGPREWTYVKPHLRKKAQAHLHGYDRRKAPVFEWPPRLKNVVVRSKNGPK